MPVPQPLQSRLIGALFVERGLVSESQVRVALEIQRETGQQLGQILVDRFGVSRKELASVVAQQWAKLGGSAGPEDNASWRRLGEIFVERGFVTQEELDGALERQRQTGERLGEALVAQGVISKFELAGALAEQMATLGDPDATNEPAGEQVEATVHHLPIAVDPSEVPWGAAVEEETHEEESYVEETSMEETAPLNEPVETFAPVELVVAAEPAEPDPEPGEPVEPVPADTEPDFPVELVAAAWGQPALEEVEPVAADEPVTAADPEPVEGTDEEAEPLVTIELVASASADAVDAPVEPGRQHVNVEEPSADPFPEPTELLVLHGFAETNGDAARVDEDAIADIACLAFAPTTTGYRLFGLDTLPAPGETVDIPDVGEYLVLRVGRTPVPHDDRVCVFLEERVTPSLVEALASS